MARRQHRGATGGGRTAPGHHPAQNPLIATAVGHYQAGRFREASQACQQILALDPENTVALHLIGLLALEAGRHDVARDVLARALGRDPRQPDLHVAMAEALRRLGRVDEAMAHYRRALALEPRHVEALYNGGNLLLALKRREEAIEYYDRALAIAPDFAAALNNRGSALFQLGAYGPALAAFERALAIAPDFADAWANRGTVLIEVRQFEKGIASCDRALELDANNLTALANRGNGYAELRQFPVAAKDFERLLTIAPDYPYAPGRALYYRLLYCDWTDYDRQLATIESTVAAGGRTAIPFMFLNMSDSVELRMRCARAFSTDKYPPAAQPLWRGERYEHDRIRVAYLSADFRHHPMAHCMAGVFEAHDRSRFETIAVSFGPDPQDALRRRLEAAFDRFIDVQGKSDGDIAALIRELQVDIAVDLMGFTNNSRPAILSFRPAPVQVNYVGFAGTLGLDYLDYIVGDEFIIPKDSQKYYTEQVIYLPDTYWPTDNSRTIGGAPPTRADAGLPETGLVFCCFNQNYKIAPPVFDVWMRLLREVAGSVLWLVTDVPEAMDNLRREAVARGVAPGRLIFAPRVGIDEYLARFGLADLFLDTLPFNAHTTAADALWMGVPVVTCAGASFASRVAGSVLQAVGMSELITKNLAAYEALVLSLARDATALAAVKAKLLRNRGTCPLFDTRRFTRNLETAYETMWRRSQEGLRPIGFAVAG